MNKVTTFERKQTKVEYFNQTEKLISAFMDDIWHSYDTNNSGFLEKDQAVALLKELLFNHHEQDENLDIEEQDFEVLFKDIDLNSKGRISRDEIRTLIKEASGL